MHVSCSMQIETLGEFGVVFTVLCVALDFSTDKLRKVSIAASMSLIVLYIRTHVHYLVLLLVRSFRRMWVSWVSFSSILFIC